MTAVIGVGLGIAVVVVVGWLTMLVSRRVFTVEGEQQRTAALAQAEHAREGADPGQPIDVESPAQIEPRVEREPCLRCGGNVHVDAHEVEQHGEARLRRVLGKCGGCGALSTTWFRVRLLD